MKRYALVHLDRPAEPVRLLNAPVVGTRRAVCARVHRLTGWNAYHRAARGFRTVPLDTLPKADA